MNQDQSMYNIAIKELIKSPIQGPFGMYHVKNGQIFMGYTHVPINGFSTSDDAWFIFH